MSEPLLWSDNSRLGYEPMDAIHEEFVALVFRLQTAAENQLTTLLDELLQHTEAHFSQEDKWMNETGFPPRECHIDEHSAVLASIRDVQRRLAGGETGPCRVLGNALADWFPGHATHLDSALAHWMFKRKYGGKPVVIHRTMTQSDSTQSSNS